MIRRRAFIRLALPTVLATAAFLLAAGPAAAASPWWHLTSGSRPTIIPSKVGSKGQIVLTAVNLGDATAHPEASPIRIADTLPPGLKAVAIEGVANTLNGNFGLGCSLASLTCTIEEGTYTNSENNLVPKTLPPYDVIEVRITVRTEAGAGPAPLNRVAVSGGGAPAALLQRPLTLAGQPAPFGVEDYELAPEEVGGAPDTQAGSHPFQVTTTITLNQNPATDRSGSPEATPVALAKDLHFKLPPGLIGNPSPFPTCTLVQFLTVITAKNQCPPQSAVGVSIITFNNHGVITAPVPLFNLEPAHGEPARFGFLVPAAGAVILDPSIRSGRGEDYGVTVSADNISQLVSLISSETTFWGVPGDSRHDIVRGYQCLDAANGVTGVGSCNPSEELHPPAFLTLPTPCSGAPLQSTVEADSWIQRGFFQTFPTNQPLPTLDGCNQLPTSPTIEAEPTSDAATSPTGLNFEINASDEGLLNHEGLAQSQIKKAVVTLPQGFTTNPSVAAGLHACTEAQYEAETVDSEPGEGCPNESKVGDVEIESPLIEGKKVLGSLYVAKQHENPYGNLLTLYLVARNPELGVLIKQALKVTPDPVTGQLTTEVDNIPQLPFSHFGLSFRQGQRSPLITPPACGTYTVAADLYPYSNPTVPIHDESSFQITQGPEGGSCPSGGTPPFHPNLEAGTINNRAGSFSPFFTKITRRDSEQEITHFSIKLPPGVIAKLAGVGQCSDAQILAAKAREHEGGGEEEELSPSCPAASQVGRSLVGSGVGNVLAYAPGKLYLAGPYHGAPLSFVSITAAKVGPFDLGTVVVRFALRVDPETAEVFVDSTGSDPIPHIVDGIPVHLRDVRAYVDRPEFTINPTSCEPSSTASTVLGSGLDFVSAADDQPFVATSPFQAADCAALPFKPKLSLQLKGSTKRGGNPALHAHLAMHGIGEAGLAYAQTSLPPTEFLDNAHIGTVCTRVQFKEGALEGEKCPPGSLIGHAKAVTPLLSEPLEGPIYLRSNPERELPDIAAALHAQEINVVAVGHTESAKGGGLRNTFEVIPDAPITSVDIDLFGGKRGLLENAPKGSADTICGTGLKAAVKLRGHNGKRDDFKDPIHASGCKRHKHGKRRRHRAAG
jgi:hypothetical protein